MKLFCSCFGYVLVVASFALVPLAHADFGFSPSEALNSDAATDGVSGDQDPAIASDGKGVWVAVWSSTNTLGGTIEDDADILFARSTDNGASWSVNALLNSFGTNDSFGDFQPSIATDGKGNWVCVWYSAHNLDGNIGSDFDILVSHSTDNGVSWSPAIVLNSNASTDGTAKDEFATVASDGNGNWVCVWHSDGVLGSSTRDDYDIHVSHSSDIGATWSTVAALNSDAATDTAYDQDPRVETDRAGRWIAVWESDNTLGDTIGSDGDLLYSISEDNGATWSTNAALNTDAATDTGYETFPSIATDRDGNWVVVWEGNVDSAKTASTDYETMSARSSDNGSTWSAPIPVNNDALTDDDYDSSPSIATDRAGTWIAIWRKDGDSQSPFGNDNDIVASKSTDNGATWTDLDAINQSVASDTGGDDINALATDGLGHWIAVWRSNDSLGNTIGTDTDILEANLTIEISAITVIKPNGGETWMIGNKETIQWETTGGTGKKVVIELLKNGSVVETIKNKTKNDGKFKWEVPGSVATGNNYKVRVRSKSDDAFTDDSDSKFKIKN